MIRSATRSDSKKGEPVRRLAALGLSAAALLAGTGCDDFTSNRFPPYRYRLTAEVETPRGIRSGSSVIEVQWGTSPEVLGSQQSAGYSITGEAVAVDLPGGDTLFVLLSSPSMQDWAAEALNGTGIVEDIKSAQGADRAVRAIPRTRKLPWDTLDNYPYFVRFRDASDPTSVEQVDPGNLAAAFGSGTSLRALTVQIVEEPVSSGIERRLPWLGQHPEPALKPDHSPQDRSLAAVLTHGAFKRRGE